jgi:hypothetical protein
VLVLQLNDIVFAECYSLEHIKEKPQLFTHFLQLCLIPDSHLNSHRIVDLMTRHSDLLDFPILLPLIPGTWSLSLLLPARLNFVSDILN